MCSDARILPSISTRDSSSAMELNILHLTNQNAEQIINTVAGNMVVTKNDSRLGFAVGNVPLEQ